MARLLNQLLANELELTREVLESLYKRNVCEAICQDALDLLPTQVLKTSIAVSLYRQNMAVGRLGKWEIIEQIAKALKLGKNTIVRHIPEKKKEVKKDSFTIKRD